MASSGTSDGLEVDAAAQLGASRFGAFAHAGAAAVARPAGHQEPDLLAGGVGPVELADQLAPVEDADAIGERQDLVELGRHEQHGDPLVAHLDDAAVDELDRSDVEAPGGLGDDEQRGRRATSPGRR